MSRLLRVGTRASRLAMVQARTLAESLVRAMGGAIQYELVPIKTTGDILYHQSLAAIGGKGLFLKEVEDALIERHVDFAVHSMKDMPVAMSDGLVLPCIMPRDTAADCLIISPKLRHLYSSSDGDIMGHNQIQQDLSILPKNALVGTCSTRRKAILLHYRNDLRIVEMRGNVDTRLAKVTDGLYDAAVLATAGLRRLNLQNHAQAIFNMKYFTPAAAQGAIVAQCRSDNRYMYEALALLNDYDTELCVTAERAFLEHVTGDCTTPVGAYAEIIPCYISNSKANDITTTSCVKSRHNHLEAKMAQAVTYGKKLKLNSMFATPNGSKLYRTYHSKIISNNSHAYEVGKYAAANVLSAM